VPGGKLQASGKDADLVPANMAQPVSFQQGSKLLLSLPFIGRRALLVHL